MPVVKNEEKCSASRLQSLTRLQSKLLRHALTKFPDVKRVVYSTCSINCEENENVVEQVLASVNIDASSPIFEVVDNKLKSKWIHHGSEDFEWGPRCIYATPDIDFTTGFFIAVFERVKPDDDDNVSKPKNEEKKHKRRKQLKENKILSEENSERQGNATNLKKKSSPS
jgi:putative methyltransferase